MLQFINVEHRLYARNYFTLLHIAFANEQDNCCLQAAAKRTAATNTK